MRDYGGLMAEYSSISSDAAFLAGGGATGALIRDFNWDASPIGPPKDWPESLRTLVGLMLASTQPMLVAWGAAQTMIYNDAYAEICRDRHPAALGAPYAEFWCDVMADLGPILDRTYVGVATNMDDIMLMLVRDGRPQEAHFRFSHTPVFDAQGRVVGMFCTCQETTETFLAARRAAVRQARLSDMFEQAPGFMALFEGPDHRLVLENVEHRRLAAGRMAIDQALAEVPEAVEQGFTALLDRVFASGKAERVEAMSWRIDEDEYLIDSVYQPLFGADGHVTGIFVSGHDVTAHVRTAGALADRARELETIMLAAPAAIYINDRKARRTIYANDGVQRLLGYTTEEMAALPAMGVRNLMHPDDLPALDATLAKVDASADGEVVEGEYRMQRKDGAYRCFLDRVTVLDRDDDGRVCHTIGFALDITENRLAQSALRDSEARYRTLFETMDEGFFIIEFVDGPEGPLSDYVVVEANPAYARHTGIENIVGQNARAIVPDEADAWIATFKAVLDTGRSTRFSRDLVATRRHLELAAFRIEPPERRQVAVLFQDVSARVEAEQALRRNNHELRQRVDAALAERRLLADLIDDTDAFVLVASTDYRILAINRATRASYFKLFGKEGEPGDPLLGGLETLPEMHDWTKTQWDRAFAGETFSVERTVESDGLPRHFEVRFTPLRDAEDAIIGAYQFAHDVTDRVRDQVRLAEAEAALHQSQKMETIGQLTGGVAHDFNNLLTPIVGALDMLKRQLADDPRAQRLTSNGLQAAERARVLVQRLLAFSRRAHLEPSAVDVAGLVEGMRDLIERSLGPAIAVTLDLAPGLPPAHVDANQLELALLNLAVNARDAINGSGDGAGALTIGVRQDAEMISIAVSDTGGGMDAATLKRAVEPFFTTKGVGRGTGLGLSSVQGLAAQSGGDFNLTSIPGQGTIATLRLPISGDMPTVAATPPTSVPEPATPLRILLIDDEDLVRVGTAEMLASAGHAVTQAHSAAAALDLLDDGLIVDAVVTDHAMPGMTGSALARAIAKRDDAPPVLLVTGYAMLNEGDAADVPRLAKPFRESDLLAAVAALVA